jgi:Uncharacterized protein conserved in bacteria
MMHDLYRAQLQKSYAPYLQNLVNGKPFEPITLRGGKKKPDTTVELHQAIRSFQKYEKQAGKYGWVIEWQEWTSKKLGRQQWPVHIRVNTEEDFLYLINKSNEAHSFKKQLDAILQWQPALQNWLAARPGKVLELQQQWPKIMSVVDYLLKNKVNGFFLRTVPVPVHTKFLEQYKRLIYSILHCLDNNRFPVPDANLDEALALQKKPFLFPARWLDETLAAQLSAGMHIFAVPADYLRKQNWRPEKVILVENETSLFSLPPMNGCLAVCSSGNALHLLRDIAFFNKTCLYYWGDMDETGFCMLNEIRSYYPYVQSLFMDIATLTFHNDDLYTNQIMYKGIELPLLQPHEKAAYEQLTSGNLWLEQERLQQEFVLMQLHEKLDQ